MSKTRKYIRIMCVILSVAALLTSAAGCSRKSNKNEKVLKQIINNPDSYPQLSFAEFNTLINGKTGLSAAELPRDKACDTGDNGYDFTRYIVGRGIHLLVLYQFEKAGSEHVLTQLF